MAAQKILIVDNGAYSIKAGISGIDFEPRVFPNALFRSKIERKTFVADEIDNLRDYSGLVYRRPHERGMLVSWDAQKLIWDRVFSHDCLDITPSETSLVLTEPYFNLPNLAEATDQIVFEEYGFDSYYRCTPAALIPHGGLFGDEPIPPACMLLVDAGYSYTHVLPVQDGQILWQHAKRIDVGGKLLTNQLKHLVSFRQWNMLDETFVMNQVMERCCYVSMDWKADLETCKRNAKSNPIVQQYVLPDFSDPQSSREGFIRSGPNAEPPIVERAPPKTTRSTFGSSAKAKGKQPERQSDNDEQVLWMGNERFAVPELLFHPSDVGLQQAGLPETIALVIGSMPPELQGMFWAHIGVFGGLGNIQAFGERLERDLRAHCPVDYQVGIFEAFDPAAPPYHSALSLTCSENYLSTYPVTKAEYQEHGPEICRRRFGGPSSLTPLATGVSAAGVQLDEETDDDELDRLYAMGIDVVGNGRKKKIRIEEEEVTTGGQGWGGRRRRG